MYLDLFVLLYSEYLGNCFPNLILFEHQLWIESYGSLFISLRILNRSVISWFLEWNVDFIYLGGEWVFSVVFFFLLNQCCCYYLIFFHFLFVCVTCACLCLPVGGNVYVCVCVCVYEGVYVYRMCMSVYACLCVCVSWVLHMHVEAQGWCWESPSLTLPPYP